MSDDFDPSTAMPEGVHRIFNQIAPVENASGDPDAVSPQGARGTMQVMPSTFAQYAKPGESIDDDDDLRSVAARKLIDDYHHFNGDPVKVAAAYIGGRGAVRPDGSIRDDVADAEGTTPAAYAQKVLGTHAPSDDFDLSTARPTPSDDFDLSTARPVEPAKSDWLGSVGTALTAFGKGAMADSASAYRALQLGAAFAPAAVYDKLFSPGTSTPASDWAMEHMVKPAEDVQRYWEATPEEKANPVTRLANAVGEGFGAMPLIIGSGGLAGEAAPVTAATTIREMLGSSIAGGAKIMTPTAAVNSLNRGVDVVNQGGTVPQALDASLMSGVSTLGTGALPMSAEGPLLTRLATGVPYGAAVGELNRQLGNAALADRPDLQSPFSVEGALTSGVTGALMAGAMGGHNELLPTREALGYGDFDPRAADMSLVPPGAEQSISPANSGAGDAVDAISAAKNVEEAIAAYAATRPLPPEAPMADNAGVDLTAAQKAIDAIEAQRPGNDPVSQAQALFASPEWAAHRDAQPANIQDSMHEAEAHIADHAMPEEYRQAVAQKVMDYANSTPKEVVPKKKAPEAWPGLADKIAELHTPKEAPTLQSVTRPISYEDARSLVAGKTEKPGGVDPVRQIDAGAGNKSLYRIGDIPLSMFKENEEGTRYDGTVDAARAADYASRDPSTAPPVIAVLSPRTGKLNILDGGNRISAARMRGDETIRALVSLKPDQAPVNPIVTKALVEVTPVAEPKDGLSYKQYIAAGHPDKGWDAYREQQSLKSRAAGDGIVANNFRSAGVSGVDLVNVLRRHGVEAPPELNNAIQHADTVVSSTSVTGRGLSKKEAAAIHKWASEQVANHLPKALTEAAPQGAIAYEYPGMYGKGMTERNARNEAALRNRNKPDLVHTAEPVEGLEHPYQIVGRERVSEAISANRDDKMDPFPEEAARVQSGIEGKSVLDAAKWIADNAPPEHQLIATKVWGMLAALQKAGVNMSLQVAHSGDMVPRALVGSRGAVHYSFDPANSFIKVWINGADLKGKVGTSHEIVLHELVHAATMGAVRLGNTRASVGTEVSAHVQDLYAVSRAIIAHFQKRVLQSKTGGTPLSAFERQIADRRNNAFTSPDETLAWALTNKDAQKYLESIPYKKATAWSWFVDAVRNVLGLPSGEHTALSEVLRISDHLLEPDTISSLEPIASATGTAMARQSPKYEMFSQARDEAPEKESIYSHIDPRKIVHGYSPYVGVEMSKLPSGSIRDAVKTAFVPAAQGSGKAAAGIIRANTGEQAFKREQAFTKLIGFAKIMSKFSPADNFKFTDDMEHGRLIDSPRLNEAAVALRKAYDEKTQQVRDLGTGALDTFNVNYMAHIYKDPAKAEAFFSGILSKRSLEGGKGFLKQRKYATLKEAMAPVEEGGGGLTPITDNPVEMALLKMREMDRFIYGQKIWQELKASGLVKFYRPGQAPDGMVKVNDKLASVNSRSEEAGGMVHRGDYYAPEEAATVINNHLSPGLAGNGFYDTFRGIGNAMNTAQLAFSLYHVGFTTIDAIVSKNALAFMQFRRGDMVAGVKNLFMGTLGAPITPFINGYNGHRLLQVYRGDATDPDLAPMVEALQLAGARQRDDLYRNTTVNAFKQAARAGRYGEAAMKFLPTLLDYMNKPVFEYLVPRQKFGVFFDLAQDAIKHNPNMDIATKRAVFGKIWDSVDNRMGELVYDNVFWNRALKDALMAVTRSVGWNLGTVRELGGGVLDAKDIFTNKQMSPRTAYVFALPFTAAIIGSVIQYLYTGKGPEDLKDCFFPRDGGVESDGVTPTRKSLPSYIKDVMEYVHDIAGFVKYGTDPLHTVENKLSPAISTISQMLKNKDYYDAAIRNPGDTAVRQVVEEGKFLLKNLEPFSARNYQNQPAGGALGAGVLGYVSSASFYGLSPAPGYMTKSDADQESQEVARQGPALMKMFREEIKADGLQDDTVQRMIAAGLTQEQRTLIIRNSSGAYHQYKPRHFGDGG